MEPVMSEQSRNVRGRRWATIKPPVADFSQVKHWDRNAAPQAGNVWRLKSKTALDFRNWTVSDMKHGRLVWSYRVLTGSVWTYLVLKGACMKLKISTQARLSNTTPMFCFSFNRNDEPTENSSDGRLFQNRQTLQSYRWNINKSYRLISHTTSLLLTIHFYLQFSIYNSFIHSLVILFGAS